MSDAFSDFRYRYEKAVAERDNGTKEAILKRWTWFASKPWITVPDWVLALGITPASAAAAAPPRAKPATWSQLVDDFTSAYTWVSPPLRSPKAWAAIDTLIGGSALSLITGANLSATRQRDALDLVWPLVLAADAIESSLSTGATETAAHVAWRADLAAANQLVHDLDGQGANGATVKELERRLAAARLGTIQIVNPDYTVTTIELTSGQVALARTISIPVEPSLDRALIESAEAVRLFFT